MDLYPHNFTNESCGKSGPIQVIIPPHVHTVDKLFQETMINMGLKSNKDPYGGNVRNHKLNINLLIDRLVDCRSMDRSIESRSEDLDSVLCRPRLPASEY